ncbi:MAG TPA: zinc-binding dehydrogenase [Inquilinus sp.]
MAQAGIRPVIDRTFAFEQAKDAYRHLEAAGHVGKIVIAIG